MPRFQFSLRTLALAALFTGAAMAVWFYREPWHIIRRASLPFDRDTDSGIYLQILGTNCHRVAYIKGTKKPTKTEELLVYDLDSGKICFQMRIVSRPRIALNPTGTQIAIASSKVISIYDVSNGKLVRELVHPGDPVAMDFSPDGESLLTLTGKDESKQALLGTKGEEVSAGELRLIRVDGTDHVGISTKNVTRKRFVGGQWQEELNPFLVESKQGFQYMFSEFAGFSRDGTVILCGNATEVLLIDTARLQPIARIGELPVTRSTLDIDTAARRLFATGEDGFLYVHDWDGGAWRLLSKCDSLINRIPLVYGIASSGAILSPDAQRMLYFNAEANTNQLYDMRDMQPLPLPVPGKYFLQDGSLWGDDGRSLVIMTRRFPERWWGHFCRVEAWLAAVLGVALLWSIRREWRKA